MRTPRKIDPAKVLRAIGAASDVAVRAARLMTRVADGTAGGSATSDVIRSYARDLDAATDLLRDLEQEVRSLQADDVSDDALVAAMRSDIRMLDTAVSELTTEIDGVLAADVGRDRQLTILEGDVARLWRAIRELVPVLAEIGRERELEQREQAGAP